MGPNAATQVECWEKNKTEKIFDDPKEKLGSPVDGYWPTFKP